MSEGGAETKEQQSDHIVQRLRGVQHAGRTTDQRELAMLAADRIEQLEAQVAAVRAAMRACLGIKWWWGPKRVAAIFNRLATSLDTDAGKDLLLALSEYSSMVNCGADPNEPDKCRQMDLELGYCRKHLDTLWADQAERLAAAEGDVEALKRAIANVYPERIPVGKTYVQMVEEVGVRLKAAEAVCEKAMALAAAVAVNASLASDGRDAGGPLVAEVREAISIWHKSRTEVSDGKEKARKALDAWRKMALAEGERDG